MYYPLGVALSKVFTEEIKGSRPSVQATKASVENLTLLQQGQLEVRLPLPLGEGLKVHARDPALQQLGICGRYRGR